MNTKELILSFDCQKIFKFPCVQNSVENKYVKRLKNSDSAWKEIWQCIVISGSIVAIIDPIKPRDVSKYNALKKA